MFTHNWTMQAVQHDIAKHDQCVVTRPDEKGSDLHLLSHSTPVPGEAHLVATPCFGMLEYHVRKRSGCIHRGIAGMHGTSDDAQAAGLRHPPTEHAAELIT